jgi:glycogen operon protein
MFRFFKGMIAFRKSRWMLGRSRYWREDVRWYGPDGEPDLSNESRSLAWRLSGAQFDESDLYVMINGHERALTFHIQEGQRTDWLRMLDTSLAPPQDIVETGQERPLASLDYEVGPRSIVVLTRRGKGRDAKNRNKHPPVTKHGDKAPLAE